MNISEFFFNFRFSSIKSQSQQKLAKKITYLKLQVRSKKTWLILQTLTHLTLKNTCSRDTAKKPFSFYKFPTKHLVGVIKNIDTAPFLDASELPSRSTLKANVCIFLYIYLRKFLFQRRSKLLAGFVFYLLHNFLKATRFLGLAKCFTIFHFNWDFSKFNYLSAFWYFHI